jgi:hypothetical protein
MIPKGVRGNKRSKAKMFELEEKIRALMYCENPRYTYEEILAMAKIPKRTLDRYRSKIWKEDAPKREQELRKAIEAKTPKFNFSFFWKRNKKRSQ